MNIDFFEFGEKTPPIIFLHGWQQNKKSFSSLVPFLYKQNQLYLLDLPGFGKSDFPGKNFNSFDYAREIIHWINQKKLKKVILAGHSFGGKIASIITANNPDLVEKLILIASSGIPETKPYYPYLKFIPKNIKNIFSSLFESKDYKSSGKLVSIFKEVVKEDIQPIFSQISTPTLIIWGIKDEELPLDFGKKISHLIKNSSLKTLEAGHFPFIDKPEEVAELIIDFIN